MVENTSIYNESLIKGIDIFKGAEGNPFLAPRGVFLTRNKLIVSDTGQNRVFIWNELPKTEFQEPDVTLGQESSEGVGRNSGGKVSASSLLYPSGIWSNGKYLIVADAWNHRVLIWNEFPQRDGQPADVVLGQEDFQSNEPNIKGIAHPPSAQSLYWPYGVFSDEKSLWIADTGNRRVLYFEEIPTTSFQAADGVIGKASFEEKDYDNKDAIWPYSVKVSPNGQMAITDTQYYRVLLWENWKDGLRKGADTLIGQKDFEGNGQNQYAWFPEANTLNWCYDSCFYKEGLWVADTGNSRILWHPKIPKENNAKADDLLGQDNFNTGSENKNSIWSTEKSYYWPFSLCIEEGYFVVADTGNHRIVINHLKI
ncbi:MAG: hypothetical protein R8P61_36720 [Bacteroidia bacterium]|nr:hypothetical protein [Bacteroidia bacterium]